jgi:hypothetical protein
VRFRRFVVLGAFAVIVGACSAGSPAASSFAVSSGTPIVNTGASPTTVPTIAPTVNPTVTPALALTSAAVVQAFTTAGLEAMGARPMTVADFGMAPKRTDDATHFNLPSLCSDCGGRAFVFTSLDDLHATKDYYDSLGKSSAMFFSWTYANEGKLTLVQINGTLSKDKAEKYGAVVQSL